MRRTTRPATARPGFTLVELMVAMALSILIMAILAGAFQVGLDTMSQLKSVAGLSGQLRTAEAVLLRDLGAPHLEDEWAKPVLVSDAKVQATAWTGANQKRGFFMVRQISPLKQEFNSALATPQYIAPASSPNDYPFVCEGYDTDGVPSYRATDHVLHMTSRLSGTNIDQVYTGLAPANLANTTMNRQDLRVGNQFVGTWAEVLYFLKPGGLVTTGDDALGGRTLTLFTLYRRQRVLTPSPFAFAPPLVQSDYPGISVPPAAATPTNDPLAITTTTNRLDATSPAPIPSNSQTEYGTDILLSNVISFQIRLQFEGQAGFSDEWQTGVTGQQARTDGAGARVYDTADDKSLYPGTTKPRIRAVQIKLRVYDTRNKMTRQITIIQDV
jgi:type II secretory pathway pseudopilin PulG